MAHAAPTFKLGNHKKPGNESPQDVQQRVRARALIADNGLRGLQRKAASEDRQTVE